MGDDTYKKTSEKNEKGLKVNRYFTKEGTSVYDLFKYEKRSSVIRNPSGDAVFEMNDVEVPASWSQVATDILAQKYFRKAGVPQADGSTGSEKSIKQVAHRMADCWKSWGMRYGYFASKADADIFYDEIVYTITGQLAAPNSPQWFNTGLYSSYNITGKPQGHYYVDPISEELSKSTSAYERPQPHACFILSVDDDLVNEGGIMDLWVREARIFKYGSGVGTNFSKIRGDNEKLAGGGYSSGLMSFLKIGDRAAGAIKSGGTTRRAAKMVCLDLDHPEIESFVNWKVEEEKKVAALIAAGYSSDYEGEAYKTVAGQNSNNSVRISNSFFKALKGGKQWDLTSRMSGKAIKSIPAQKLWDDIAFAAWACADPGVQFDSTINEWHTCPEGGRINASNPCSEYMFLDNTACNLASINLAHFFDPKTRVFDVKGFEHACRIWTIVLEISVLMAQFPSKEVAQLSYDYRTLGLGYANLGSALMVNSIPYDSKKARAIGGAITAIMTGTAYATSAEMARELGTFKRYEDNKQHMLRVMRNHRYAAYNSTGNYEGLEILPPGIEQADCPDYLLSAACNAWDKAVEMGEQYGYRNAQTTVIAPTGTIGLVMDCDTTGIEPDFALVKFKKLSGGGYFKIINQAVPEALSNLGYTEHEVTTIVNYAKGAATLKGAPHINTDTLKAKGLTDDELDKLDKGLVAAFEISFAFNIWSLGEDCLKRLGFKPEQYNAADFNVLRGLGFSRKEIAEANEYVCGTMTIEGAPYLKTEHYPIFDCANKCGAKGERYIHSNGHIKMMAAAQPFLSGAISKTINLPNEANVDEIKDCYELSWALGLKANALYRDGCKLSQPLSTKSDTKEEKEEVSLEKLDTVEEVLGQAANVKLSDLTSEQVIEAAMAIMEKSKDTNFMRQLSRVVQKKSLPFKRRGYTQKASIDGQTVFVRTGEYEDGTLGEIFVDMHKEGATFRSLMNCFAIAVSVGLQYGVPLEEYVEKFTFTRFEPAGMVVGHANIKSATSIIDYIFRMLGYEYQDRTDLVHVITEQKGITGNPQMDDGDFNTDESNVYQPVNTVAVDSGSSSKRQFNVDLSMGVQSDAPACSTCGHTTIRSGTCYKCLNCGNSMGCS
ncbi:vitamin B12-dependent ribonucleotide reductase [Mucilaginibacter sp. BJC16-A38]|uniref:vitamin B12-dependent ribonucleotide reductase n=1 Tax=Mucilaginibacter phenanthrenivorans TaxID=1234842 RepID=UPI0021576574|nr:vitamin B12-dependent ribonucleotide reductase [Mucilaginibacter phenanthrenivorans]MCR8557460.1 vitamin B12-dependent ribonucleotide reductase [Mucilaginibacter phenanthrenivorans]